MSYVANGTYGCVLKPAMLCANKKKNNLENNCSSKDCVSKVFDNSNAAKDEQQFMKRILSTIDPLGQFTIRSFGSCPVSRDAFAKAEIEQCTNIKDRNQKRLHQIVYENGGVAISQLPWSTYWTRFGPVFEGIEVLQAYGMAHQDIKPDNIVYNAANSKMALIDFGLYGRLDKVFAESNAFVSFYLYMPPEIAENALRHKWLPAKSAGRKAMTNFYELVKYSGVPSPLNRGMMKRVSALATTYRAYDDKDMDPYLIDSYMLGATLLEGSAGQIDLRTTIGRGLADLICGLIHPDLKMRWTIDRAKVAYYKLVARAAAIEKARASKNNKNKK